MRLSETITIYLAAGAPFGVASLLRAPQGRSRTLALLKATGVMLLWPLAASAILLARQRRTDEADGNESSIDATLGEKVERAAHELLASVYKVYELAQNYSGKELEKMERATCLIRESVEKYVGLAMAATEINPDGMPGEREMELCRVAGRTGDDLLLAGLCIHRRNVARINTHGERARAELVHMLAEVREIVDATGLNARRNASSIAALSEAILKTYGRAIEMFSLLDDHDAAMSVARLLDAECARLRRLETAGAEESRATPFGEEPCETFTPHLALRAVSQGSNLNQG
jgi:hypothetical protein